MLAPAAIGLLLLALVQCRQTSPKSGLLAVIRDKVTPEEISEVILNPRKRDLTGLSSYKNQIDAGKIKANIEKKDKRSLELKRNLRAVRMITTRLTRATDDQDMNTDENLLPNRLKRIVLGQNARKSKPLPAVFLTAVARVVVPAKPETAVLGPESKPRLLRLHEVRRAA